MRRPPVIEPWLSTRQLQAWVRDAPDRDQYRRRAAIWMVAQGPLHAPEVARLLVVSVASVWQWIGQYNAQGPEGLAGPGRGGRRHGLLSTGDEAVVLQRFLARARRGHVTTAHHLRDALCEAAGQEVSLSYVYDVLRRHDWRKIVPRPRHPKADPTAQAAYKKTSPGVSSAP